jgi:hypothetical protein
MSRPSSFLVNGTVEALDGDGDRINAELMYHRKLDTLEDSGAEKLEDRSTRTSELKWYRQKPKLRG